MAANFSEVWQKTTEDPLRRFGLTLVLLNGLTVEQVIKLTPSDIDIENRWIRVSSDQIYPLVDQAAEAYAEWAQSGATELSLDSIPQLLSAWEITEAEAHRRLAGALWYTSEDGRIIRDISGTSDAPVLPLRFTFPFSVAHRLGLPSDDSHTAAILVSSHEVLQIAADWLVRETLTPKPSIVKRVSGLLREGRTVFLLVSTGVNALNLLHNFLMGRLLSPADYSQLTLIITLQLLIGLLPSSIQTITSRFSAVYFAHKELHFVHALKRIMGTWALRIGLTYGVVVLLGASLIGRLFQLSDSSLLLPMALAWVFLVLMSVDRGLLQGLGGYFWLSGAYLGESLARLGLSVLLGYALLSAGHALDGAVWGVAQSVFVTWFITFLAIRLLTNAPTQQNALSVEETRAISGERQTWLKLGGLTLVALIGQALITNSDFLLVKTFFPPTTSGLYAAISVLGRIAYFGAMPITLVMVPLIARRQALDQPTRPILILLLSGGLAMCGTLILATLLFGGFIMGTLYGSQYLQAVGYLPTYTLAASLYVLTNLAITYRVALGRGDEAWMPLVGGIAQVVGITLFHNTLEQVILVQIVLMAILLAGVMWRIFSDKSNATVPTSINQNAQTS